MATDCDHLVGYIPGGEVKAGDWNWKLKDFVAQVDDFNVRGQRDQINHPGFAAEFRFCPNCGHHIDRIGLGLLSYEEAFKQYDAGKTASRGSHAMKKQGWAVKVVEDATGEVVKLLPARDQRDAEKIERGLEINLNHEKYTCSVVEPAKI